MERRRGVQLTARAVFVVGVAGCASRTDGTPVTSPVGRSAAAAAQCREVDVSAPPVITSYQEGGITVHSFVAPETSAGTATHIVETDDAVVVVDTQMLRAYAEQFHAYAKGLGKPITHVLVSHAHPDHYFGLEYFESYPSYALPQTREQMQQRHRFHLKMHREGQMECDAVTDRVRFVAQDLTPGQESIGGVTFVFEHVARAEDNDQLVIRVPAAKTLILQDLMATDTHGFTSGGMTAGWVDALRRYENDEAYTHVLAGHGSPTDRAGITAMIAYVQRSQEILDAAADGPSLVGAMQEAFPDKVGTYILDLTAELNFGE